MNTSFSINELGSAVRDFDFVVNLLPLTEQTRNVFTKDIFRQMKRTSFFINIGRGDSVIENDLIDALENDVIAGAGIDVFSSSSYVNPSTPLRQDSPLLDLENVILTPHIAGLTNQYWDKECALFIDNLTRFINLNCSMVSSYHYIYIVFCNKLKHFIKCRVFKPTQR